MRHPSCALPSQGAPVIVVLGTSSQAISLTMQKVTIEPAAWNATQSVNVSAVDNKKADASGAASVHFSTISADPLFNNLAVTELQYTIVGATWGLTLK